MKCKSSMQSALQCICLLTTALLLLSTMAQAGIEKIEQDLKPFDQVILNGNFNVTLVQAGADHIIMAGREKVLAEMEILQKGSSLIVQPIDNRNMRSAKKIEITLYYQVIRKLELNGISGIACATPIESDQLELHCNGIRDLELNLEVAKLHAVFNGMGTAYIHGRAINAYIEYIGIGNLHAFDLVTDQMDIISTGIGRVEVHAIKELKVEASGIGRVRYAGDPAIKDLDGSGIGNIKRARHVTMQ